MMLENRIVGILFCVVMFQLKGVFVSSFHDESYEFEHDFIDGLFLIPQYKVISVYYF